jgi:multidrug efflux pump subunit AcrB
MTFAQWLLSRPHAIISASLVAVLLGIVGFLNIPTNLFPNTNRPMVAVVTQWAGAMSTDISNDITHPLEVRMTAIDGVRRALPHRVTASPRYRWNLNTEMTSIPLPTK